MTDPVDPTLADRTQAIYTDVAARYDTARGRDLFEKPWLDRILQEAPQGDVLDLGCGAGEPIAAYMIETGRDVTGVDFAQPMLDLAAARWPDQTWINADMRALDLGRRFAALIAFNSFFHLPPADQPPMFQRFADHLLPGGVLWFSSGTGFGEVTGSVGGQTVYHASLTPDAYRALLVDAGFNAITFTPEDPTCRGHSLWFAKLKSAI